jgi:hypothetical protein
MAGHATGGIRTFAYPPRLDIRRRRFTPRVRFMAPQSLRSNLLRYRELDGRFQVWPLARTARNRLFLAGERLILHRQGDALYELTGEVIRPLSNAQGDPPRKRDRLN